MNYDDWLRTERHHADITVAENAFGYVPGDIDNPIKSVVVFDPGVAVILQDGTWFSHIGRSEYSGTGDQVRQALWRDYANDELNGGGDTVSVSTKE